MSGYRLTPAAEEDFISIWRYTVERWGEAQADRYYDLLEQCCEKIGKGKAVERQPISKLPLLRVVRCEHHHIFYLKREVPEIIAVFHEKMDVMTRLTGRLGGKS